MMARRSVLGLMAGGMTMLLGGCGLFGGNSYRFKMTVEVETPQGLRTGSSVYEVWAEKNIKLLPDERAGSGGLRGEALIVHLPTGPMFLLLKNDNAGQALGVRVTSALVGQKIFRNIDEYVAAVGSLSGGSRSASAELPKEDWPMMVKFGDINDPKTVRQVGPATIGVKRIVVEVTNDPVTAGIEKMLTWLPSQRGSFVRRLTVPDPTNPPLAAILNKTDFSSELAHARWLI